MQRVHIGPSILVALFVAGCSLAPPPSAAPGSDPVLVVTEGPAGGDAGMSVAEALTHQATDDLVSVSGALFVDPDGTARLCEAIAESFPPQCGGQRITVQGLDHATMPDLEEANGVRWAESVVLFGSVE
jgi:hypothetical protein